jgi:hypothetical protein
MLLDAFTLAIKMEERWVVQCSVRLDSEAERMGAYNMNCNDV